MSNKKIKDSIFQKVRKIEKCTGYDTLFKEYYELILEIEREDNVEYIYKVIYKELSNAPDLIKYTIRILLLWKIRDVDYISQYLDELLYSDTILWENKYFLRLQIIMNLFTSPELGDDKVNSLLFEIYNLCTKELIRLIDRKMVYYFSEERTSDLVFVMTNQFIAMEHGPTKTALDRCYELIKNQHKNVILINTAEFNSNTGRIMLPEYKGCTYCEQLSELDNIEYMGLKIPFMQFPEDTPNVDALLSVINIVEKYKPEFIMHIGGGSIITDICSNIVPTISISTVPSGLCTTNGTFQVIGHKLRDDEIDSLIRQKIDRRSVIEGVFTSSFKQQENIFSKTELGLPDNKTIAIVVGARLTSEVTEEFLRVLVSCIPEGLFIVFVGDMENYDERCTEFQELKDNSKYLGFQKDVLAVCECCDLYINPYRVGGGTSVIEAMSKGLPAISLDYGDVALGAGEDFVVNSYDEMKKEIIKYTKDKDYYDKKSKLALERVKVMTDTHEAFSNILHEFYKRIKEYEWEKKANIINGGICGEWKINK